MSSPTTTTHARPSPTPTPCASPAASRCWPWRAVACASRSPTAPLPNSATNTASRSCRGNAGIRQHRGQIKGSDQRVRSKGRNKGSDQAWGGGSAFEDGGDAHAAGGADADQGAAAALFLQQLGGGGDDAGAGGGEGMAEGERTADDVELLPVDRSQRRVEAEFFLAEDRILPGLERAQHLRREGLV